VRPDLQEKGLRHGQAVELLPNKCKALSSNPHTTKKKKKRKDFTNPVSKNEGPIFANKS
jgi:hypothetical protein